MPNICTKCKTIVRQCFVDVYKLHHKGKGFYAEFVPCVDPYCYGSVVEIDENILPIIKLLWNKNYTTKFCCSGHVQEMGLDGVNNIYIYFDRGYKFQNIPTGFKYTITKEENNKKACMINKRITKTNVLEYMQELADVMQALYKWAEELPQIRIVTVGQTEEISTKTKI